MDGRAEHAHIAGIRPIPAINLEAAQPLTGTRSQPCGTSDGRCSGVVPAADPWSGVVPVAIDVGEDLWSFEHAGGVVDPHVEAGVGFGGFRVYG